MGEAPERAVSAQTPTFLETGLLCYYETNSRQQRRQLMKTNPQTHPLGSAPVENIILGESANLCCSFYVFKKIYRFLPNLFTVNPYYYYYLFKVVGWWGRVKDSHVRCIHENASIKMQMHTEAVIIDCLREEKADFSHLRFVVKVKSGLQSII